MNDKNKTVRAVYKRKLQLWGLIIIACLLLAAVGGYVQNNKSGKTELQAEQTVPEIASYAGSIALASAASVSGHYDTFEEAWARAAYGPGATASDAEVIPAKVYCGSEYLGCFRTAARISKVDPMGTGSSSSYQYYIYVYVFFETDDFEVSDFGNYQVDYSYTSSYGGSDMLYTFGEKNEFMFSIRCNKTALTNSYIFGENDDISLTFSVTCDSMRVPVELPPDPEKEGYTFTGWCYGTQEEHEESGGECEIYDGAPIFEDTELHAHWRINEYTVKFDSSGGTAIADKIVNWNTPVATVTPEKRGYNFVGWYLPDGAKYENQVIKEDTVLTAHWEIKILTVTFYVDGEVLKTERVEYGTALVKAMEEAKIVSYRAMSIEGVQLSKQNSVITEDTQIVVKELTGWEKYGDFVGRNPWFTWATYILLGVSLIVATVGIVMYVRR